jgi:aspartate ammonia-lyase
VESSTATATALLPALGYERAGEAARLAAATKRPVREVVLGQGWLTAEQFDELISPEAVCRLGTPTTVGDGRTRAGREVEKTLSSAPS